MIKYSSDSDSRPPSLNLNREGFSLYIFQDKIWKENCNELKIKTSRLRGVHVQVFFKKSPTARQIQV